jgi:hypothetical protein
MKLDLYRQQDSQDPTTGAIAKTWQFHKTVDCAAKSIINNSASVRGSNKQMIDTRYQNDQVLEVRTEERITVRDKITNIRDSKNNCIWTELNYPSDTPTVFEIVGITPITDPFGNLMGYSSTVKRSENQQIGF